MFSRILRIDPPVRIYAGQSFQILMHTDGPVAFAQCILRQADGWEWIIKDSLVETMGENTTRFTVPLEAYHSGILYLQLEGCKTSQLDKALPEDWIKVFLEHHAEEKETSESTRDDGALSSLTDNERIRVGLCIALHQHLSLPAGLSPHPREWTEENGLFFNAYMEKVFGALERAQGLCLESGHLNAGILFSWSGQLIECLKECAAIGHEGEFFAMWNHRMTSYCSSFRLSRLPFCRCGWSDDLLLFQPEAFVRSQLNAQEEAMNSYFTNWTNEIIYPPSLGFSPYLIPHFSAVGAKAVLFDILHHYRACLDYPGQENLPPPNRADQENYRRHDWMEMTGVTGTTFISPGLLRPSILVYTDSEGHRSEIVGLPFESTLSEMLIRGEREALSCLFGNILDRKDSDVAMEPESPLLALLSAGENPEALVERVELLLNILERDPRLSLISPQGYLDLYSVDSSNLIHLEAGVARGQEGLIPFYRHDLVGGTGATVEIAKTDLIQTAMALPLYSCAEHKDSELQSKMFCRKVMSTGALTCQRYPHGHTALAVKDHLFQQQERSSSGIAPVVLLPWYEELDNGKGCIRVFAYASAGISAVTLYYHEVGGGYESLPMQEEKMKVELSGQKMASLFQLICPSEWGNIRYFIEIRDRYAKSVRTPLCRRSLAQED